MKGSVNPWQWELQFKLWEPIKFQYMVFTDCGISQEEIYKIVDLYNQSN